MAIFNLNYILKNNILKKYFIKSDDDVDNCCILVKGYNHPMRARSSMIVLDIKNKNDIYVLCKLNDQDDYGMPGGGWNKGETPKEAAIRECHEETLCDVKNVKYEGILIEYRDSKDKVNKWVKDHVDEKDWWYGYYSIIFVGLYNGKYSGYVDDKDRENGFKWVDINNIINNIPKEYKDAINNYINNL